jgi:hypothetical protein
VIPEPLDADGVRAVVAIPDPVLRNLWITQSYFELGERLQRAVGGLDRTWCGFAVWASDTAGQSIRGEELPKAVQDLLRHDPAHRADVDAVNRRLRPLQAVKAAGTLDGDDLVAAMREAIADVGRHIAHGNTLVYAELAPLFVAFLDCLGGGDPTEDDVNAALDRAATDPIGDGLREAFHWYWLATRATDDTERAHAILAGNVLAVAHEQERLQDDIAASLNAGVSTAGKVLGELLPRWVPDFLGRLIRGPVAREVERLIDDVWDSVTTELLMTLRVPGAVLRLSHTLPALPDGQLFPAELADLGDGDDAAPYRQWDRTSGTGRHDGAHDWVVLGERMSFIVNLFRSRQQDGTLSTAPFSAEQVETMEHGAVPPPPLLPRP